jgi:RNA polymerase sigma-70 factor (ECF subfamily)
LSIFRKTYKNKPDEALMVLLSQGNERAFNEIYSRYAEPLFHFFYRMLYQDEELAADFCQNLFLKVFEKARTYNPQYKCSTWIYTMASNMCKNEYRRISRKKPTIYLEKFKKFSEPKAPKEIDNEIFQNQLQKEINKLDEKHKLCFILRYQDNKSIAEISELLSCPLGTVKSRLHNATKKIRRELFQFDPKIILDRYE